MRDRQSIDPQAVAIAALGHVAADPVLLPRFLSLTGIEAPQIRQAAREPGFLVGVLDFVLAHGPTLMEFSEASGISPEAVATARQKLGGASDRYEVST